MNTRHPDISILESTAVRIGTTLGMVARQLDRWRGHRARPAFLEQVLQDTQQQVQQETHEPPNGRIGSLAELAHLR